MGHRALVAYEKGPDQYDVHYTHWGAVDLRLVHSITAETPYAEGEVREDPRDDGRGVTLETVIHELLDYVSHEALYIVDQDYSVTAWGVEGYDTILPLPDDFRNETPRIESGVAFPVRWHDGEPVSLSHDRGMIRGFCKSAGKTLKTGRFDGVEEALEFIHSLVRSEFMGSVGKAQQFDEPMFSNREDIPFQYRQDVQSVSEIMADGGQAGINEF